MSSNSSEQKKSIDQYGRTQWNLEAYAKEAKGKRNNKIVNEASQEELIDSNRAASYLEHRSKALDELVSSVKEHSIINPFNTDTRGKSKRFGFVCQICDLSFRDTMALIDHINSPQHLSRVQDSLQKEGGAGDVLEDGVRRATFTEVQRRLEKLVMDANRVETQREDINERIKRRQAFEMKKREMRRKRRQKRKEKLTGAHEIQDNLDLVKAMGFGLFGSLKGR